ncbi:MAG: hypothetical protein PHR81_02915 [Bacteroidales bacterium]|nr:hypothetical protein [Bacteroidales bacterium]MDD4213740.1 hypothetical protein [Bacteroidales bacterium]
MMFLVSSDIFAQQDNNESDNVFFARISHNTCGIPDGTADDLIGMIFENGKSLADSTAAHCLINTCIARALKADQKQAAMDFYDKSLKLINVYSPLLDFIQPYLEKFLLPVIQSKEELK